MVKKPAEEKSSMAIGKVLRHPLDNRMVKIIDGDNLSNWWNWREVHADGSFGDLESGYGW